MLCMTHEEGKTAGWPIPAKVKEGFTDFCKEVGSLAKDDCAGALFAWEFLPAQIREWAKLSAKGDTEPHIEFWFAFRDYLNNVIERSLSGLLVANTPLGSGTQPSAVLNPSPKREGELPSRPCGPSPESVVDEPLLRRRGPRSTKKGSSPKASGDG